MLQCGWQREATALVVGRFKNPRDFKNVKSLPVDYKNAARAWMTSDLFKEFLRAWDVKLRLKNRHVLLLLDRCSAHPVTLSPPLANIKLQFLQANATSVLQPLDQGIIRSMKVHFRTKLVQYLLFRLENLDTTKLAKIDLLKAIHYIASLWDAVSQETIAACFAKAGVTQDCAAVRESGDVGIIDDEDFELLATRMGLDMPCTFGDFLDIDSEEPTSGLLSDKICEHVSDASETQREVEVEKSEEPQEHHKHSDVVSALNVIRRALNDKDAAEDEHKMLGKIENCLTYRPKIVQTTLLQHFR